MKSFLLIVATLASGIPLSAVAQTPAAPAKVAIIAFQDAVSQTNESLRDFAEIKRKYQPKQDEFKARGSQIDNLAKQLQAQAATLSAAQRDARAADIESKRKELDTDVQTVRKDFQAEVQDDFSKVASKVYDVLNDYARQHGYTMVLDIQQQNTPVLYSAKSNDITKQVVSAYNLKSGIAPPPAAAPAAATPHSTAPGSR
jgi:outer membrane protein